MSFEELSSFDEFLAEEGILQEAEAEAQKRVRTFLEAEFIECRDALACAVNWLDQDEDDGDDVKVTADVLVWLNRRLDKATLLADKLASLDKR